MSVAAAAPTALAAGHHLPFATDGETVPERGARSGTAQRAQVTTRRRSLTPYPPRGIPGMGSDVQVTSVRRSLPVATRSGRLSSAPTMLTFDTRYPSSRPSVRSAT